jgi:hypothetical protein
LLRTKDGPVLSKHMPDPLATLCHTIFNMSLA